MIVVAITVNACVAQNAFQLQVVKDSPFLAKFTTESVHTLADGNRIVHKASGIIARDSIGRTRREEDGHVFLHDPAISMAYVFDTQAKSVKAYPAMSQFESLSPRAETLSLGSLFVNGVLADGSRLTKKIPPGDVGNDHLIEIVSETWFAQSLQTVVQRRTVDPRIGTTEFKLTEITLGEPPSDLFVAPKVD